MNAICIHIQPVSKYTALLVLCLVSCKLYVFASLFVMYIWFTKNNQLLRGIRSENRQYSLRLVSAVPQLVNQMLLIH